MEWNREAERISGYSRAEVLGKDYFELFLPEENWKGVAADIKEVLDGENYAGLRELVSRPRRQRANTIVERQHHVRGCRADPSESLPSDKISPNESSLKSREGNSRSN